MKHLLLFSFCLTFPFLAFNQDYKEYLKLSYVEIDSLIDMEFDRGAFDKAIPYMQAGREKAKKDFDQQASAFADYTNQLGSFYIRAGQYKLALPLFLEGIEIGEKMLGKDHPEVANSLNNLAGLHQRMGNPELALPLFLRCIKIDEKTLGKDHRYFAASLNNLALLHQSMGNFELALPLFLQTIKIQEKTLGKDHPEFASSLNNLASLHKYMGNFDLALPLFLQARDIREKVFGKNHPKVATSLNNLAILHQRMGNLELALPLFLECIKIDEKTLGKNHHFFAISLNNFAGLHKDMGNFELALPLFLRAKNIREKALGKDHPDFASSLNNLASLHFDMGNYLEAWSFIGQAINCMSRLQLNYSFSQNWKDSLQNATFKSNQHINKTISSLTLAYEFLKKDSSIADVATKQMNIADLASFLLDKTRNQTYNEKDKLRLLGQSNTWLQNSLMLLNPLKHFNKAFSLSEQNKSVLLLQATKSEAAYRLGELPDSLVLEDKKLMKKQSRLQAKLLEKRPDSEQDNLRNELNDVNQDIGAFVKMIEQEFPKYHKLKYAQIDTEVKDIQALLAQNTALLEYVIGDSVVHIFLVDKKEVLWQKSFVSNKQLEGNIKAFHQSLSNYTLVTKNKEKAYNNYKEKAYWFYRKLILPVLKDRTDINNLIIVTDGALGHLPFETFLIEPAPQTVTDYQKLHYLVNDYNISYNYSATLWKENKEAPILRNNGQILAMAGNYEIQLDSSMIEVRLPSDQWLRKGLSPLPAARKEVEILQEKYQGFFAFDTLASEKTVKDKASDFAVLHFATHGILNNKRPILSSLVFSEDNNNKESNFWQAHEISKIKLNANLVVLSACETGYGKFEKGNGIASLARAFMYAGAPALIVSLWQVNDYATSEIMKNLYDNLANGMKKDEALRQSKLQYMKIAKGVAAHPIFWSPFIMMGNTESVSIKRKGDFLAWGIGVLGVLFLLYIVQRKVSSLREN